MYQGVKKFNFKTLKPKILEMLIVKLKIDQ